MAGNPLAQTLPEWDHWTTDWRWSERFMAGDSGGRVTDVARHMGNAQGHCGYRGHKVHRTNQGESFTPKGEFNPGAPLIKPTGSTVRGHQADGFTIKGDGMPVDEFKRRSGRLRRRG